MAEIPLHRPIGPALLLALLIAAPGCERPNPAYIGELAGGGGGNGDGGDCSGDGGDGGDGAGADTGVQDDVAAPPIDADLSGAPAARFALTLPVRVTEGVPFKLRLTALDESNRPTPSFKGAVELFSDRGDIRPGRIPVNGMPGGSISVDVALNREGATTITVAAEGDSNLRGQGAPVQVEHPTWRRLNEGRPVLDRGFADEWDDRDVQHPAVLRVPDDSAGPYAGSLLMFYRGRNTTMVERGIGLAVSSDGVVWRRHELNPVMPSERLEDDRFIDFSEPEARLIQGGYRMWATATTPGDTYIIHAESADAVTWVRNEPNPVIWATPGENNWEELWVWAPAIAWSATGGYEAWYGSYTTDGLYGIGRATSLNGTEWTKHATNPVLPPSDNGWDHVTVDKPAVLKDGSVYRMWYTGDAEFQDNRDDPWSIGYATSIDGVNWEKCACNPILSPSGVSETFDLVRVANPSVVRAPDPDDPTKDTLLLYYDAFDGRRWRIGVAAPTTPN